MSSSYQHGDPDANNGGEEDPLLEKDRSPTNGTAPAPRTTKCSTYTVGVVSAGLLALALFLNLLVPRHAIPKDSPSPLEENEDVLYRPLCRLHNERFLVRGIQTSMKDPSHQWAPVTCFAANDGEGEEKLFSFVKKAPQDPSRLINAFAAPDALLQVNFSRHAFPGRPPILGFGGAFTEASARNFHSLTAHGQDAVIELLFGKNGLGYALGRIHMNSCDFSVKSYTFDETDGDFELKDFDMQVTHDVATGMVDFAKRAVSKLRQDWASADPASNELDGNLKLYASPWSPPGWMKNPTWEDLPNATHAAKMAFSTQPSCLREGTGEKSRYAAAWALYFSKYLTAYSNLGLPFWGVTVQNEPEFPAPWEACSYTPTTEAEFVAYHLGPRLKKDHPEVKLLIFDHNKDHIIKWATTLLNSSHHAAQYVDGTSYHWYAGGMDRLLDGALGIPNLHRLQHHLVAKNLSQSHLILGSEACHCPSTGYSGGNIAVYWARAERYAHTILADLAAGSNGWVEWNLILDSIGGPNHLGNDCEATILAVPHRAKDATPDIPHLPDFEPNDPIGNVSIGDGRTREELNALGFPAEYLDKGVAVQPIYFYMGHVSRFVRPGSRSVPALVTQGDIPGVGRIFRPQGSVVTGGGENDLARVGIELSLWPCEGSTRQQFSWTNDRLGGNPIIVHGHDWLGHPTNSCVSNIEDADVLGVRLEECTAKKKVGLFDFVPMPNDPLGRYRIYLKNARSRRNKSEHCLIVRRLSNNGGAYGPRGGAQVTIGSCAKPNALWKFDSKTGVISSYELASVDNSTGFPRENESVCMTTGWPFLQMGAFAAPGGNKTVVILNEANDPANYALVDDGDLIMTGSIPARSVQSFELADETNTQK